MSRSGLKHLCGDLRFSNENVQLLGGNFYGRIFTRQELSSRRECYQDFASRQDSHRDPREEFFPWRDPGKYRFLGRILAEIRGGNFSWEEGSCRENGPPQRDPGERQESWRDPCEIPVPILQGMYHCITPKRLLFCYWVGLYVISSVNDFTVLVSMRKFY